MYNLSCLCFSCQRWRERGLSSLQTYRLTAQCSSVVPSLLSVPRPSDTGLKAYFVTLASETPFTYSRQESTLLCTRTTDLSRFAPEAWSASQFFLHAWYRLQTCPPWWVLHLSITNPPWTSAQISIEHISLQEYRQEKIGRGARLWTYEHFTIGWKGAGHYCLLTTFEHKWKVKCSVFVLFFYKSHLLVPCEDIDKLSES